MKCARRHSGRHDPKCCILSIVALEMIPLNGILMYAGESFAKYP